MAAAFACACFSRWRASLCLFLFLSVSQDIKDHKCSWLVVQALQRVTPAQREVLNANYGRDEKKNEAAVKALYNEIGLEQIYQKQEEVKFTTHTIRSRREARFARRCSPRSLLLPLCLLRLLSLQESFVLVQKLIDDNVKILPKGVFYPILQKIHNRDH